ncbi:type-X family DNA polymerase [Sporobolomyces salmoneus]|uniref:type-X family DNA polymerase n=1 Tax=Sporobolomyces salmoneus TaxID=183962 RepID=UPI00317E0CB9
MERVTDFWDPPEMSFEEKLANLQKGLGRHPAYKDQWGRDPDGSDTENGLSDDPMERLVEQDRREFEKRLWKPPKQGTSDKAEEATAQKQKKKRTVTKKKRGGDQEEEEAERKTSEKKRKPSPPSHASSDQPMPDEESRTPIAGPSNSVAHSTRSPHLLSSPPPLHPSRKSSPSRPAPPPNKATSSSSESECEAPAKKKQRVSKAPVLIASKTLSTAPESTTTRGGGGAKGKGKEKVKGKARLSMEQALEEAQKIKVDELKTRFADISSFIDHLSSFEIDRPGKLLQGCRVVFVNADHWKANSTIRNRLDQGLRLELGIVARQGGTLIKPEAFVGAPQDANQNDMNEEETERRAEAEGWTTHIIGFHPSNYRSPTFDEVLGCLGESEGGLTAEQLGPYVKVVTFPWVSQCVKERKRQSEWEFAIKGDPREISPSRVSSNKSSPTKKKSPSAKDRRQGRKKKGPDDEAETSGESQGEEDEGVIKGAISPFGTQDYPAGERPPRDDSLRRVSSPLDGHQHQHSSEKQTFNPLEGLEEQSKIVKKLGNAEIDGHLNNENPDIFKGVVDDNETDEEEEEVAARREGREVKKPNLKETRADRKGYAVNREFVPPGQAEGPNDAVADVLLQLAELNKGDQWRERGYRQAAGALRRLKHKVTDYKDLVKIRGIGSQIAEKIVEINMTGTHRKLQNEIPETKAARLFSNVYGIGLALGHELAKRGAKTIEDLRKEEFYSTLTVDQQIGLDYYDDLLERIPRAEVTELYKIVLDASTQVDPKLQVECMGSYRRGQANSGDIDILVTRDPSEDGKTHSGAIGKMYKILRSNNFFQHILSQSDDWSDLTCKVNGLCKLPGGKMRRIDILGVPFPDMPAALIYFTGNDHFNRSLRLKARHMGYSLNQKCLSKNVIRGKGGEKLTEGTRIDVKSERDIFRILGVPYKRPEERIPS